VGALHGIVVKLIACLIVHAAARKKVSKTEVAKSQIAAFGGSVWPRSVNQTIFEFDIAMAHPDILVKVP
jgi:hypothetical protein